MSLISDHFRKYIGCFKGISVGGIIIGYGTTEKRDIIGSPAMQEAYKTGNSIQ